MSGLFGTSGVRGIFNKDITPELMLDLSKSLGTEIKGSGEILIGRDTRITGKIIEDTLISGFLSTGCNVRKTGITPTPVVGFSVPELGAKAGAMITASHNPAEYNGVKFFDSKGMALTPEREEKIEKTYQEKDFKTSSWNEIGETSHSEVIENYLSQMIKEISIENEYKAVIDCASGPSSKTTPPLLERLGCEVLKINSDLDGTFPERPPEPVKENLQDICSKVKSSKANIGFAHDGDGDRIAVVDEEGRVVSQDKLLALVGSYSVERFGKGIVTPVNVSKIVDEKVSEAGGEVQKTKVGDVNVAQEMDSQGLLFGGEPSGTWIIGDIHMCPDGTLAAARVLEMLSNKNKKLSELVDSMPSYPVLRTKIDCPNEEKANKMKSVKENALSKFEEVENMLTIDGVRLEFENGDWILIRPSGTEPYIRITAESEDEKRAKTLVEKGKELLVG